MAFLAEKKLLELDDRLSFDRSMPTARHSSDSSLTDSTDEALIIKDDSHVESQLPPATAAEHQYSTKAKLVVLTAYFLLNLFLTLSNKAVLRMANYPWLLTTAHVSATSIGCFTMLGFGAIELTPLGRRDNLVLIAFSFLFTLNIAISNVSLAMVSVPFHQITRSTCPVVTILIYKLVYGRDYSMQTYLTMIPLVLGVAISTAGDYYFTAVGFALTLLGVFLASVKTVATNRIMTGSLKLSASEALLRMSPLAAVQCAAYAFVTGEAQQFWTSYQGGQIPSLFAAALLVNAAMAFMLNGVGFQANKMAGALTITVCGNVKQALTILLGIVLFHVEVGVTNAVGMVVTIAGAVWYSKVELDNKRAKPR